MALKVLLCNKKTVYKQLYPPFHRVIFMKVDSEHMVPRVQPSKVNLTFSRVLKFRLR